MREEAWNFRGKPKNTGGLKNVLNGKDWACLKAKRTRNR